MNTDFLLIDHGSIVVLTPQTYLAKVWVDEHIPYDAQWIGRGVAIEPRYVDDIINGVVADHLEIKGIRA